MRLAVIALAAALPVLAGAQEKVYRFNDKNHRDTVTLTLEAPFEKINGLSNAVLGEVRLGKDTVSASFKVPVNSLKTGNELRDEHLTNDRWLDAAKNPYILFTVKDLKLPAGIEDGKPFKLSTEGEFTIKGIKRKEKVELTAVLFKESDQTKFRADGDLLHVRATFQIPIEQYGIKRTEALLLKVGEVAEVSVDAWGSTKNELPPDSTAVAPTP